MLRPPQRSAGRMALQVASQQFQQCCKINGVIIKPLSQNAMMSSIAASYRKVPEAYSGREPFYEPDTKRMICTTNSPLKEWGYDHDRMTRPPAAVRFQAEHSNALWHFDLSPSDLKQVECPAWIEPGRGAPTLMIYSVVDDRSGVAYQEYHGVYGEDVEAALRFLFNAMAPKPEEAALLKPGFTG
jgi:hypothetical protein